MRKICTLFFLSFLVMAGRAQTVSSYTFSEDLVPYTPVTGGTNWQSVIPGILDNQVSGLVPIGFTFRHAGTDFTQFSFNANGYIALGEPADNLFDNFAVLSADGTPNHVIAALNNDLQGRGQLVVEVVTGSPIVTLVDGDINQISIGDAVQVHGFTTGATVLSKTATTITLSEAATDDGLSRPLRFVNANTGIRFETIGAAPNRRLVVQWTGFGRQSNTEAFGELYNFQIILYETTNVVEFVYDIQGPDSNEMAFFQVGMRGASQADFTNRTSPAFDWFFSQPGVVNSETMPLDLIQKPAQGLVFRWIPPNCTSPDISAPVIIPDCVNNEWSYSVDVTSLGNATSLSFGAAPASPAVLNAPGTVTFGPFTSNSSSPVITVEHNLNNACNRVLSPVTYICPPANDECITALPFPAIPADGTCMELINQTADGATESMPPCAGEEANDVWYSFEAPGPVTLIELSSPFGPGPPFSMVTQVFSGNCGSLVSISCTDASTPIITLTGLVTGTRYYVRVHRFNSNFINAFNICIRTPVPPPVNDEASGAISIPVNAGCAVVPYTNVSATASANEPYPSCSGNNIAPVWFSFIAPAAGAVRISTDYLGGSLTDMKVALFSGTDLANYSDFQIISCDDNGGAGGPANLFSVLYATGLTGGSTYYIAVDKNDATVAGGTFCLTVEELSGSHLALNANCLDFYQTAASYGNNTYTGWVPLMDNNSNLIALVKRSAGADAGEYSVAQHIISGPVRSYRGVYYMDRNFRINNPTAANTKIQFFYMDFELAQLAAAAPGTTADNIGVVKQAGTACEPDFSTANGTATVLWPEGKGVSADGQVRWVEVSTSSFSNFYLQNVSGRILPITLVSFAGQREGGKNKLRWTTIHEQGNRGFEIQRSADGITYTAIGFVNSMASGGSNETLNYTFTDADPADSRLYYRLKQTDIDGNSKLSNVVLIKGDRSEALSIDGVYPNPANTQLNVRISTPARDKVTLLVTDMTGRTILQKVADIEAGSNTIPVDISRFTIGSYLLKLVGSNNGESISVRFVKQ